MKDLWADQYQKIARKTPGSMLKEQALKLGKKTNHQVNPRLDSEKVLYQYEDSWLHRLLLTIPALPHYRYGYLTMMHGADLYPLVFLVDEDIKQELDPDGDERNKLLIVESEEEFVPVLQGIFNAKETQRIVGSLQARNNGKEVSA